MDVTNQTALLQGRYGVLLNFRQRRKLARQPLDDEWLKKTEQQREQHHSSHLPPTHTIFYVPLGGCLIPYLLSPKGNKARRITEVQACRLRGLSAPVFAQEPVGEPATTVAFDAAQWECVVPPAAEPAAEEPAAVPAAEEPAVEPAAEEPAVEPAATPPPCR